MLQENLFSLWQRGTDLQYSKRKYVDESTVITKSIEHLAVQNPKAAREKVQNELLNSNEKSSLLDMIDKLESDNDQEAAMIKITLMASSLFLDGKRSQWDVLHKIQKGKLIGLGYVLPRAINDLPVRIPDDIWDGKINWKKSTLEGSGLSFTSIRIIETKLLPPEVLEPINKKTPQNNKSNATYTVLEHNSIEKPPTSINPIIPEIIPRKTGRKSRKSEILNAFKTLAKENKVSIDTSSAILGHLIREHIFLENPEQTPSDTGLSDETIRRIVRSTK